MKSQEIKSAADQGFERRYGEALAMVNSAVGVRVWGSVALVFDQILIEIRMETE